MKSPFIDDAVLDDRKIKNLEVDCRCEGNIVWFQIPNTEWTAAEVNKQIQDAQQWFQKYCIFLTFGEFALNPAEPKEAALQQKLNKLIADYQKRVAVIPRAKAAPQVSLERIESIVEQIYLLIAGVLTERAKAAAKTAEQDVKDAKKALDQAQKNLAKAKPADKATAKAAVKDATDKLAQAKAAAEKAQRATHKSLVVFFLDEWFVPTGEDPDSFRTFRVSANHGYYWLISIDRYDRQSTLMLGHELAHGLRKGVIQSAHAPNKKCFDEFVKKNRVQDTSLTSWADHYSGVNQDQAILFIKRSRAFQRYQFPIGSVLSVREYLTVLWAGYVECGAGCGQAGGGGGAGGG